MKTNVNKTNVSIKFNSIEEYREIKKKLIELGYRCIMDIEHEDKNDYCSFVSIDNFSKKFRFGKFPLNFNNIYNSLEEFLKHE